MVQKHTQQFQVAKQKLQSKKYIQDEKQKFLDAKQQNQQKFQQKQQFQDANDFSSQQWQNFKKNSNLANGQDPLSLIDFFYYLLSFFGFNAILQFLFKKLISLVSTKMIISVLDLNYVITKDYNYVDKLYKIINKTIISHFPSVIQKVIIIPIFEELLYRGLSHLSLVLINKLIDYIIDIFPNTKKYEEKVKYFSEIFMMILSSFLFALTHWESQKKYPDIDTYLRFNLIKQIVIFAGGIMIFAFSRKYGLDKGIILHGLYNGIVVFTGYLINK